MDYTPLNRHEQYLNAIRTGDTTNLPQPINREETYLYDIAMNGGGGGGATDAVKYTEQSLTSEQQAQARTNIGAAASTDIPTDAVKYTAQTLTDAQKTQARTNIGAAAVSDIPLVIDYSTTEQDTGIKWVDGKPIFQKTYVFDSPVESGGAYVDAVDVSNMTIDTLVYMSGIEHDAASGHDANIAVFDSYSSVSNNLYLTADKATVKYISPLVMDFLTLRYTRAIIIIKQPEDVTVEAGKKFTMSVEATGENLTYQWQYMRPTDTTWNNFSEATSNTLNRTATINWDGWTVHCVITDTNGRTAISDEATITIAPSDGQKSIPDDEKQVEPIDDESKTLKNINGPFTWTDEYL